MENLVFCFSGLAALVLGLLSIFAKDLMWKITVWQNQNKGLASERTENWERGTTIGGVIVILVGLFLIYVFFRG
jgi:hypothetical protein